MAIMDERTEFADAVSVAAAAGTANIGDIIDCSVARDMGNGQPIYLVVSVDANILAATAGTIAFQLVSDGTSTIATDGSQTIHYTSKAFVTNVDASNALDAGAIAVCVALPIEGVVYERYMAVQAVVATATVTAGAISAYLSLDPVATKKSYNDAI